MFRPVSIICCGSLILAVIVLNAVEIYGGFIELGTAAAIIALALTSLIYGMMRVASRRWRPKARHRTRRTHRLGRVTGEERHGATATLHAGAVRHR